MTSREEILEVLNQAIREEHGMPLVNDEDILIDSGIDSFGTVMVLNELCERYDVYCNEELKTTPILGLTLGDIIERIQNGPK